MARKRENATMEGLAGLEIKDLRKLPDNDEFTISLDERRKLMRRVRKSDDKSKAIEKTRARCSLAAARAEEEELRLQLKISGGSR